MRKIAQVLEAFSEKLNFRKNGAEVRKLLILDWSTRVAYVFFKLITIRSKHFLGCEQLWAASKAGILGILVL